MLALRKHSQHAVEDLPDSVDVPWVSDVFTCDGSSSVARVLANVRELFAVREKVALTIR